MENLDCALTTTHVIVEKQWFSLVQVEESVVYNSCTKEVVFQNRTSDLSHPFGAITLMTLCILLGYIMLLLDKNDRSK